MYFSKFSLKYVSLALLCIICSCGHIDTPDSRPEVDENGNICYKKYVYVPYVCNKGVRLFAETAAWHLAKEVYKQDTVAIKTLCAKDISLLSLHEKKYGVTLLAWAVLNNRYYSAKTLLEAGANPNDNNIDGQTPLTFAAEKDWTSEFLKLLLKHGGNANNIITYKDGMNRDIIAHNTPLVAAVSSSNLENVKILVKAGADANLLRVTVLSVASTSYDSAFNGIKIIEYLINEGGLDFKTALDTFENNITYPYYMVHRMEIPKHRKEYEIQKRVLEYIKENGGAILLPSAYIEERKKDTLYIQP